MKAKAVYSTEMPRNSWVQCFSELLGYSAVVLSKEGQVRVENWEDGHCIGNE